METRYVVCDDEGACSWDPDNDCPESFKKFKGKGGAEERAKQLADCSPGIIIRVYELTAEVVSPVRSPETSRRHPIEHYK